MTQSACELDFSPSVTFFCFVVTQRGKKIYIIFLDYFSLSYIYLVRRSPHANTCCFLLCATCWLRTLKHLSSCFHAAVGQLTPRPRDTSAVNSHKYEVKGQRWGAWRAAPIVLERKHTFYPEEDVKERPANEGPRLGWDENISPSTLYQIYMNNISHFGIFIRFLYTLYFCYCKYCFILLDMVMNEARFCKLLWDFYVWF